eukprot:4862043-Amphidinium_carterae.1
MRVSLKAYGDSHVQLSEKEGLQMPLFTPDLFSLRPVHTHTRIAPVVHKRKQSKVCQSRPFVRCICSTEIGGAEPSNMTLKNSLRILISSFSDSPQSDINFMIISTQCPFR